MSEVPPELPPELPEHPVGTLAFVGTYLVLVVVLWVALYVFVYLARGPVTP
jgi:hypothetical protein